MTLSSSLPLRRRMASFLFDSLIVTATLPLPPTENGLAPTKTCALRETTAFLRVRNAASPFNPGVASKAYLNRPFLDTRIVRLAPLRFGLAGGEGIVLGPPPPLAAGGLGGVGG